MDSTLNNEHNSCDEILLSAYLDGEVTAEKRRAVEGHVVQCKSCAELVARMQHVEPSVANDSAAEESTRAGECVHRTRNFAIAFAPRLDMGWRCCRVDCVVRPRCFGIRIE